MARNQISGDFDVTGTFTAGNVVLPDNSVRSDSAIQAGADIAVSKMAQRTNSSFLVPLHSLRKWNDATMPLMNTVTASAASSDDLAYIPGNRNADPPTAPPLVKSTDAAGTTICQKAMFEIELPENYDAGETVTVAITCKMEVASDGTATVELELFECDNDGTQSADLCATAAAAITNAYGTKTFTITPTNLAAGDVLRGLITIDVTDALTANGVLANISRVELKCDTRG
jgi:hypothetical protein